MAQTDEATGWRADKNRTGCVLDVRQRRDGHAAASSMPHSPALARGAAARAQLWPRARSKSVDPQSGERVVVERFPGSPAAWPATGDLAFVGLSRIRETAVFGGLPIADRHAELKCGVAVVDLRRGRTIATLEFESGIEEIFDVQVVPDARAASRSAAANAATAGPAARSGSCRPRAPPPRPPIAAPARRRPAPTRLADAGATRCHEALAAQRAGRRRPRSTCCGGRCSSVHDSAEIANHLGNALQDAGDQHAGARGLPAARRRRPGLRAGAAEPRAICSSPSATPTRGSPSSQQRPADRPAGHQPGC